MAFLEENDAFILRNVKDPEQFVEDSFEAIPMGLNMTMIVGVLKEDSQLQKSINPGKRTVQAVRFAKPDWTIEDALAWLTENMADFKSDLFIKKYEKGNLKSIDGVEIFSAGTWNGDKYTTKDLDEMVRAFEETKSTVRPFLKLGHSDKQKLLQEEGLPAAGWIGRLYRKGEKLIADFVDMPSKIFELIDKRAYRKVSSEIYVGVKIKDRAYKYMLGAVALLGSETPGVMNLSDILARYGLKDFDSIKSYTDSQSEVTIKEYSIDKELIIEEGDPMSKTEKEMELELKLKQAQEKVEALEKDAKKFKSDLTSNDESLKKLKEDAEAAEKRAFDAEKNLQKVQIEKQVEELVSEDLITKGMKPFVTQLLGTDTKKYSFKVGDKDQETDKFGLIKKIFEMSAKKADVNFDESSLDGKGNKKSQEPTSDEIEKYAAENKLSFSAAYKEMLQGKLKIESDVVQD